MISLALDASTYTGTVAVLDDAHVLGAGEAPMRGRDAEHLMPLVESVLREAGVPLARVGRVVCGAGPGSFTSLRIAASMAKGIAVGRDIPLFGVSSLALVVAANAAATAARYLALFDALRGDCYAQLVECRGDEVLVPETATLVPAEAIPELAARLSAKPVGPAHGGWQPHARGVNRLLGLLEGAGPVELASWEPSYGRDAEAQTRWEAAHGRVLPAS